MAEIGFARRLTQCPVTWAAAGLVALTLMRLWIAAVLPLAPDEAYYWVWSRALATGYLDHPPMVALWIRVGTALAGTSSIGVRLLGPFAAALGSVLLYDAAERLFPGRRAGVTAAVLLNATLAFGTGAVIMTPDTPLLLFWTATIWAGARLVSGGSPKWWLTAGVFAGLALTSKYTAAFLPAGLALFARLAMPRSLRRPEPWLGGLIAGVLFLPVVIWNYQNGWAGFLRQGGRAGDWRPDRAASFLAELVFGQVGLATPGVFVLFAAGIAMAIRMAVKSRDPAWTLLASLSVPPALVFVQHAIGDRVQGNWPAILYPAAAIAAAGLTATHWRRLIWPSAWLGFAIALVVYAHAIAFWPAGFGGRDPVARQLYGWHDLAARADTMRKDTGATFVAAEPYGLASELAWATPTGTDIVGAGTHWDSFALPRANPARGMLIRPDRYGEPDAAEWTDITRLPDIVRTGGGAEIERYAVFLARAAGDHPSAVMLPQRGGP
jgi:4-amino-4-deoxy-L-arabinose transferase-like glycosyltransferase